MLDCKFLWQGYPSNDLSYRNIKKGLLLGLRPELGPEALKYLPHDLKRQISERLPSSLAARSIGISLQKGLEKKWSELFAKLVN